MSENKKKFRVNFFDIIIVVIVACVGIGLYVFTHRDTTTDTKKLTYKIELNETVPGLADYINIGDQLFENTKNYSMGTVAAVETTEYKKITPDYENNIYRETVDPTSERVVITVTANVTESNNAFAVDGQYIVRAGNQIFVKGPGFAGEGYVISIER